MSAAGWMYPLGALFTAIGFAKLAGHDPMWEMSGRATEGFLGLLPSLTSRHSKSTLRR